MEIMNKTNERMNEQTNTKHQSVKRLSLRPFNFANIGVVRENREIFWELPLLTFLCEKNK